MFDILNVRKGPDRAKCTMYTFIVPLMIFLKVALIVLLLSLTIQENSFHLIYTLLAEFLRTVCYWDPTSIHLVR